VVYIIFLDLHWIWYFPTVRGFKAVFIGGVNPC